MNEHSAADLAQDKFTSAVRNYEPRMAGKLSKLLPFKEGITELRRKRASYETIADILRNIDVAVSRFTVARFCREILKLKPLGRRRSNKSVRPKA